MNENQVPVSKTTTDGTVSFSFNANVACKLGVNQAIFIQQLIAELYGFNNGNSEIIDGRNWIRYSAKGFCDLFPFWSTSQIRTIIIKLSQLGILIIDTHNEEYLDRTKWYSVDREKLSSVIRSKK